MTSWKQWRLLFDNNRPVFVLGVGAQKAGTTWLYQYLKACENTNMGDLKEYHIWDGLLQPEKFPEFVYSNPQTCDANVTDLQRELQADPQAYFRHFRNLVENSEITGDLSPSYCGLSAKDFRFIRKQLRRANFRVKIVFLMRDPVERCWSASRMFARNREMRGSPGWTQEQLVDHFAQEFPSAHYQVRTRYEQTLQALDRAFPGKEVYLGFYENMFELANLQAVAKFLGVATRPDELERTRNASAGAVLPENLRKQCHDFYRSTYEYCWARFPQTRKLWPPV